jgi:hypothetical protein
VGVGYRPEQDTYLDLNNQLLRLHLPCFCGDHGNLLLYTAIYIKVERRILVLFGLRLANVFECVKKQRGQDVDRATPLKAAQPAK